MRGTAAAADKITVKATREAGGGAVKVELTFYQELLFPFVDGLFAYFGGGRKIMYKGSKNGLRCFPIRATTNMRAAAFDVMPGANCYEYGAGF